MSYEQTDLPKSYRFSEESIPMYSPNVERLVSDGQAYGPRLLIK